MVPSWQGILVVDADRCSHADVDSGVPRAHRCAFAASLIVFGVVGFMPDFSSSGDDRDTILPAATLGFRRPVLYAGMVWCCGTVLHAMAVVLFC